LHKSTADNKIYFAGGFLSVNGNTDHKNIVRYDREANLWEGLPGIDYTHNMFIRCMVSDENGNMYVGGDFNTIGGVPAGRVARFNVHEGRWYSLIDKTFKDDDQMRGPLSGGVYAIHLLDDYVYIGGWTFNNDDPAYRYIRRFNVQTKKWESVGAGIGFVDGNSAKVSAFASDPDGNLYVGGTFTLAGGQTVSNIAKWDGTNWSDVSGGLNGSVASLVWHNDTLYVAGSFTKAGNVYSQGIIAYHGNQWISMNNGVNGIAQSVVVDKDGTLYIGGFFETRFSDDLAMNSAAVWKNNQWEPLGLGLSQSSTQGVNAMLADGSNIYCAGAFYKPIGNTSDIARQAIWNPSIDFDADFPPVVGIILNTDSVTNQSAVETIIQFSEEIQGLELSDLELVNAVADIPTQQVDKSQCRVVMKRIPTLIKLKIYVNKLLFSN